MRSRATPVHRAPVRARTARASGRARKLAIRRRALLVAGTAALCALGFFAVRPLLNEAIKEITLPLRHEDIIRQQARDKHLDPALIAAVIYRESKFRDETSRAGAKGLMQVLPVTADFVAKRSGATRFVHEDLENPQVNIAYGSYYLRYLLDHYDGNTTAAVAAYNAGETHVDRWGGASLTIDEIRFPETRQYTVDVLHKRDQYAHSYKHELGL